MRFLAIALLAGALALPAAAPANACSGSVTAAKAASTTDLSAAKKKKKKAPKVEYMRAVPIK